MLAYDSPIGTLYLTGSDAGLSGVWFDPPDVPALEERNAVNEAARQLDGYFAGTRHTFDLPLAPAGTEFQRRVWTELEAIPYGHTTTYGDLAARLGDVKATRAVGLANGRNPISIIVPCHRVIGADGSLTGYGGGLDHKRWLLVHEGALLA